MANHCRCCSGKFIENDVLGDCPGCPECADATEWHAAMMAQPCEEDVHCACVPVLRMACADRDAQLYRLGDELAEARLEMAKLQTATRKLVETVRKFDKWLEYSCPEGGINADKIPLDALEAWEPCEIALADPVIVALGRE
jgi:hypothetical protein